MKITRLKSQGNHIIIGVNNIDAQMKEKEALEQVREEHSFFIRMVSLYGDFMSIYTVDPATDEYYRYSSIFCPEPEAKQTAGSNFYAEIRKIWEKEIYEEDQPYFFSRFKKEIILNDIRNKGKFIMNHYRLLIDGRLVYVILRATMIREKGKDKILMGIINVNDVIRKQEEYEEMEREAMTDELTGVKRKHAYQDVEKEIDKEIITGKNPKFAVAVFDINGLKEINDTYGHLVGDQYIIDGSRLICRIFQHSPVYRIGGDEFAVIAQGEDYRNIDQLMGEFTRIVEENRHSGGVVVAAGVSKFTNEKNVAEVFQTADQYMYRNKEQLKKNK
jgi:diguanylate cyclase (GGDEF)-like protein